MQKLYYQFPETWFGDCMPFGHGDKFYLYHQRDTRKPGPFGEPFWLGFSKQPLILFTTKTVVWQFQEELMKSRISLFSQEVFLKQKDSIIFSTLVTIVIISSWKTISGTDACI